MITQAKHGGSILLHEGRACQRYTAHHPCGDVNVIDIDCLHSNVATPSKGRKNHCDSQFIDSSSEECEPFFPIT